LCCFPDRRINCLVFKCGIASIAIFAKQPGARAGLFASNARKSVWVPWILTMPIGS
jgi:hypothetical protein